LPCGRACSLVATCKRQPSHPIQEVTEM
jgi:hypothetical protein